MGIIEGAFHMLMIFCSLGRWDPVYKTRKRSIGRTSKFYAA